MSKYLYNGVELPELPEWDKNTYPYACISHCYGDTYQFEVFKTKPYADNYGYLRSKIDVLKGHQRGV